MVSSGNESFKASRLRPSRRSQRKQKRSMLQSRLVSDVSAPSSIEAQKTPSPRSFWLQTHYWHAKRFAMATFWNYRIALQCNAKTYRPLIRAGMTGSTLYDLSYEECFLLPNQPKDVDVVSILAKHSKLNWDFVDSSHPASRKVDQNASMHRKTLSLRVSQEKQLLGVVGVEVAQNAAGGMDYLLWMHPAISSSIKENLDPICLLLVGKFCKFELFGPKSLAFLGTFLQIPSIPNHSTTIRYHFGQGTMPSEIISAPSSGECLSSAFTLAEHEAWYDIRILPKSTTLVQLVLPASRAMELWRRLIYTNHFIPIGLSERRTLIEHVYLMMDHGGKPDFELLFPFYLPGTAAFSDTIKKDFKIYVLEPESRRPLSKRHVLMPPAELLLQVIQAFEPQNETLQFSFLSQGNMTPSASTCMSPPSIAIAPILMSGRGRPCFGSIVYAGPMLTERDSEPDLAFVFPPPLSWCKESTIGMDNALENDFIQKNVSAMAMEDHDASRLKKPRPFPSERGVLTAIGFIMVNPIQERHGASNGFSMVTGCGYGICIYDASCLEAVEAQHGKELCFWIQNLTSPTLIYPAQLNR